MIYLSTQLSMKFILLINVKMLTISTFISSLNDWLLLILAISVLKSSFNLSRVVRNRLFAYAKTKSQISYAVTAKLISAFVLAIRIVHSLYFLNTKFQDSCHLLWLHSPVCVGLVRNPELVFSQRGSFHVQLS